MAPQIIFGTASFGMDYATFKDKESVENLLKTLQDLDIHRLDSGARYPPTNPGRSEELIGEAKELSSKFLVDTKVFTDTRTDGSGDLTAESVRKSVNGSLQRLQRPEGVNVLHIHRADPTTPIEEQIRNFQEQIKLGHSKAWGVSNVPPPVLEEMIRLCEQNGWQKPSCYQGIYNLVSRGMETKLLPLLRAHGIKFNAFWPLAAGFLTGKFINNQHEGTRFADDNPVGKAVQKMYSGEELNNGMKKFNAKIEELGLTPIEVAIRWISHHSALRDEDGIIIGASRPEQVIDTVSKIRKGPLPSEVLPAIEELWDMVKDTRGDIIG